MPGQGGDHGVVSDGIGQRPVAPEAGHQEGRTAQISGKAVAVDERIEGDEVGGGTERGYGGGEAFGGTGLVEAAEECDGGVKRRELGEHSAG